MVEKNQSSFCLSNHLGFSAIMSGLKYYTYEGWGKAAAESFYYSQAVRVGNRIECAGQGTSKHFRQRYSC